MGVTRTRSTWNASLGKTYFTNMNLLTFCCDHIACQKLFCAAPVLYSQQDKTQQQGNHESQEDEQPLSAVWKETYRECGV